MDVVTTTKRIIDALTFSERSALVALADKLEDGEVLIASKIADDVGITRSVIVNVLSKLSAAGVIETQSLGMKGTRIKVLNREALAEIVQAGV